MLTSVQLKMVSHHSEMPMHTRPYQESPLRCLLRQKPHWSVLIVPTFWVWNDRYSLVLLLFSAGETYFVRFFKSLCTSVDAKLIFLLTLLFSLFQLVASAPAFPHGIIDDVQAVAAVSHVLCVCMCVCVCVHAHVWVCVYLYVNCW